MPNHCENTTTVFGPPSDVAEVIKAMTIGDDVRLCNLLPMPEGLKEAEASFITSPEPPEAWLAKVADGSWTQEEYDGAAGRWKASWEAGQANKAKYGYTDWYAFANAEWGTKWGDYDHTSDAPTIEEVVETGAGMVSFEMNYMTAWGPFIGYFWQKVSDRFPSVRFETRYQEFGMGFAGVIIAYKGVVIDNGTDDLPEIDWDEDDSGAHFYELVEKALDEIYEESDKELAKTLTNKGL